VQLLDVSPDPAPNVPAGHSVHSDAPRRLYRPGPHRAAADADPATQKAPAGHCTAVLVSEPSGQKNPAVHVPLVVMVGGGGGKEEEGRERAG
jgi:hypothetical protein